VTTITEKLADLRERITAAAEAAGGDPRSVTVVAVSKTHPPATIAAAWHAGLRHFGENYLQEALPKITELPDDLVWHFIGAVQANKTRPIAENFDWVQTVASAHIAERLSRQRPCHAGDLQVCIQVQPEPARARSGLPAAEVAALATVIAGLPRLKLRGLMFMPNFNIAPAALAAEFRRVQQLFAALRGGFGLDTLSMGMSADLEAAVRAGSNMVRIGTALFGERP
jgi:hypothetical protein